MALCASLALSSPVAIPFNVYSQEVNQNAVEENKSLNLTLDKAIKIAMENNYILKSLEVDLESTDLSLDRAKYNEKKIKRGKDKLDDAKEESAPLIEGLDKLISSGLGTESSSVSDIKQNVDKVLDTLNQVPDDMLSDEQKAQKSILQEASNNLSYAISKGYGSYSKQDIQGAIKEGEDRLDLGVEEVNSAIAEKLNIDVERVLALDSTTELMTTMAELQNEVTKDGYKIAQKQIALLTRQKYYEVIKTKKIEELKKVALDRANKQYEMAKNAYEEGMKAKDDVLLSQAQVKLMNVDYRNAVLNRKKAEIELKKVINIDLDTDINLVEDFTTEGIDFNLKEGIKQGLEKRIEIRKAQAQYLVDKLNFELTSKQYPDNTYQYKEAKVKMDKSKVELEKSYKEVEASIRQSYEALIATKDMLSYIENVVENAKESLEIAEYRYKEGYGFETSVIKSANLEDVAGTIVEVIAAQERLADIEEKVVEVIFNYNLARDKYLNDIGMY
ncbi:Outer membrane efflux protein [Tepidibacter thalassicus DSM 15285]|uniref:Outer membrane efflux protein n=2 Tax=Tepidibacter TaxID=214904 RepID=A0A1M5R955_9FIRM|nr:Outer membrane efflux protein [Tepidibacter thalassicus DSM 15285]